MLRAIILATAMLAVAPTAHSATMTFSNVTDPLTSTYFEDGINYEGNGLFVFSINNLHMDVTGSPAPNRAVFSMSSRFNAAGFDLHPSTYDYYVCDMTGNSCEYPAYANVLVEGYRGNTLVSSLLFPMGKLSTLGYPVTLGSTFSNLSSLVISALIPPSNSNLPVMGYSTGCGDVCSHFEIDNVTLAPVPVPAGMPLLFLGMAMLWCMGGSRRARKLR